MNKFYALTVSLLLFTISQAQTITIPDPIFKSILLQANDNSFIATNQNEQKIKIDVNNDGEIQVSEALNVYHLIVNSSNITTVKGIENFKNLRSFQCIGNDISVFDVSGLKNLTALYCLNNKMSTLKITGLENLEVLECNNNLLTDLDLRDFKKLKSLNCTSNKLQKLNVTGLINLEKIFCNYNQLTDVNVSGALNLNYLRTDVNNLVSLNVSGCTKLETIVCDNNKLTNLNLDGLISMRDLICNDNLLANVSLLGLTNMVNLYCQNNKLKSLDLTPLKNLHYLYCGYNLLENLDLTGLSNLLTVHCENNLLTSLDLSSINYIYDLFCANNRLLSLNLKNGSSDSQLLFANNPDLKFICVDENQSDYVKQLAETFQLPNCVINSYCTFTHGGVFYTIQGKTLLDSDNNGCDSNDGKYPNLNFSITNGNESGNFITNASGNYELPLGAGTHTITPILENPNYFTVSPASLSVTFPAQNSPFTQNFCVTPKGNHEDLEITILPIIPARPGFDATYKLIYKNKGNQVKSGQVTLDFNDAVLDYVTSAPVPNSKVVNKLVWDYLTLQPFETREIAFTLNVNSPMETPAVNLNDRLSFNALITPLAYDEKPVDNSFALRQQVVGSYDPNDKTCLEGDVVTTNLIGEYVHYLIRFENTGNYPAENIVVKDMIDLSKFDISTLIPTSASHSYITKISDGNKVEFIFEKINLPFDDANNDGYIAFKIKTLPTLKVGDSFTNEANIFFDYNFPILTNTATSTFQALGTQDFEFSEFLSIYPNPTTSNLNISSKSSIDIQSITIYNVLGQAVIIIANAEKTKAIDVSTLKTGNYFIKIISDKGTSSTKFIKK